MSVRVALVSPFPPKRDGLASYAWDLAEALRGDDEVGVFTQRGSRGAPRSESATVEVFPVLSTAPCSIRRLVDAVRRFRPDVLHVQFTVPAFGLQTLWLLLAVRRLRRAEGIPVIWTLHEVVREVSLLRGLGRSLYRRIGGLADRVVVLSGASGDCLVEQCGVPRDVVVHLPHGVPARPGAPVVAARPDGPVVSFGYLHPDKGIEHLLQARRILADRGPAPEVVVAGAVRPRQGVFRLFERRDHRYEAMLRRPADPSVAFRGFLADDALDDQLRAAKVVVFPYLAVTQSGAVNRAVALGCPIVASNLPGLTEDVPHSAGLVPPGDAGALAEALARIGDEPALQEEMSVASASFAERQSVSECAGRLRAIYRAVRASTAPGAENVT